MAESQPSIAYVGGSRLQEKLSGETDVKLVISVVGDSVGIVPRPWPMLRFRKALTHAIKAFGESWILCECKTVHNYPCRVTKMMMDTVKDYRTIPGMTDPPKISLFGFSNKYNRENSKLMDVLDEKFDEDDQWTTEHRNEAMVDIEQSLSNALIRAFNTDIMRMKLPVAIIIVEGDANTIDHLVKAVENNIPAVLVKGSGMAADLLHLCLENDAHITQKTFLEFGINCDKNAFEKAKKDITEIKKKNWLLTSFEIEHEEPENLATHIANVIHHNWSYLKSEGHPPGTFEFLGAHNRSNIQVCQENTDIEQYPKANLLPDLQPPEYIDCKPTWKQNKIWPIPHKAQGNHVMPLEHQTGNKQDASPLEFQLLYEMLQEQDLVHQSSTDAEMKKQIIRDMYNHLMMEALVTGKHNFVEILIDKVALEDLNIDYKYLYHRHESSLHELLRVDTWEDEYGPKLTGYDDYAVKSLGTVLHYTNAKKIHPEHQHDKDKNQMTILSLLLWAVQTNQREMAVIFWKKTNHSILTALISSTFLGRLSKLALARKENALAEDLSAHSKLFSKRAMDVINIFYEENPELAIKVLLKTETVVWDVYMTPVEFAQTFRNYDFVAHRVTQRSLNKVWYGSADRYTWYKVFTASGTKGRRCYSPLQYVWNVLSTPMIICITHYIFFSAFLLCFTAFVLSYLGEKDILPPNGKTWYEFVSYIWIFGDFMEEYTPVVRFILNSNLREPKLCFSAWMRGTWLHLNDIWNMLDTSSYLLLFVSVIIRFTQDDSFDDFSRRFYSLTMFIMFMRVLSSLLVFRSTGPTIIMIKEALKDLFKFVTTIIVFIIGTGAFYHANLYPNHPQNLFTTFAFDVSSWNYWRIVYIPFWAMFGDFYEELKGIGSENCSSDPLAYLNNEEIERCPELDWWVSFIFGIFIILTNLLLINLIIAMFSFRFEEIQENGDKLWRYHRSILILDYEKKIPSPFNLIFRVAPGLCLMCRRKGRDNIYTEEEKGELRESRSLQRAIAERWEETYILWWSRS